MWWREERARHTQQKKEPAHPIHESALECSRLALKWNTMSEWTVVILSSAEIKKSVSFSIWEFFGNSLNHIIRSSRIESHANRDSISKLSFSNVIYALICKISLPLRAQDYLEWCHIFMSQTPGPPVCSLSPTFHNFMQIISQFHVKYFTISCKIFALQEEIGAGFPVKDASIFVCFSMGEMNERGNAQNNLSIEHWTFGTEYLHRFALTETRTSFGH